MMKKTGILLAAIALLAVPGQAQEPKIEIAAFAGGYFSAGFQSAEVFSLGPTATSREFKPVDEPNSGIFGLRASYDLSRRIALEGSFGFSPAGRKFAGYPFAILQPLPLDREPPIFQSDAAIAILPQVRGKDTFQYGGNLLFHWRKGTGWAPFFTAGVGAVTRTAELVLPLRAPIPRPIIQVIPIRFAVPSPTETDRSVNFGGGLKKYFSSWCGIRMDFRNYTSDVGEDTVNNLEVSLGLILRM